MDTLHPSNLSTREIDERFDLLAADAREYAIYLIGLDGCLLCWNAGAERLFGYQASEIVGQHFSRFFSPEDIRGGQPEHELHTASADGRSDSVRKQRRKDGTEFWCKATITPLLNEKKAIDAFARVMHDLTDGQEQEVQRKRADDLAEANRGKEEFLVLLSHELRNPLSPILNALNILRQMKTEDPILQQASNIIERQVGQMVRLVDDLLDISRMTKGKLRLHKERVELRVLANLAAENVRPLMDARRHDFSVSLPTEPIWVEGDPDRLEQILTNLLNNAAKYTEPGGCIWMVVSRAEGEALVRVQDNGLGMTPEMLPRIFELFTQVDSSLGRSQGGLGIGLALVRTLVELHEGRVQASSAGLGKGSEFTIRLPALPDTSAPAPVVLAPPVKQQGQSLRVLVVEDNVDSADSLSILLRLYGHEVFVAHTGPTGLEAAAAFLPNIVLLDIGLPGMNGYEVAERLRAEPRFKDVTLCALTGYTPSAAHQSTLQTGFDHYFVKPINFAAVNEMLTALANKNAET